MAMMQTNEQLGREMRDATERQRRHTERLAQQLREQATREWQKALEGMIALPTALAVSLASTALYLAGFVARGFEIFQETAADAQRNLDERRDFERPEGPRPPETMPRA